MHRLEVKTSALISLIVNNNIYVTLAHMSVREYLLDTKAKHTSLTLIDLREANAALTRRCMTVIHQTLTAELRPEGLKELLHHFADYALKN